MSEAGEQPALEESIPLFPLSTVLFPGAPLPMQIFEERYRSLVRDLLELEPQERRFGVVAIQAGSEAGMQLPQIFPVGCTAKVRRIDSLPDGRSTLVAFGGARFRLLEVDSETKPYLTGRVRWMDEPTGEPGAADSLVPAIQVALAAYFDTLTSLTGARMQDAELPRDTTELSYLTAGALILPLRERQALLELADTATRLRAEVGLLRREKLLMSALNAVNAPELFRSPRSPN
jgi:uncharacterized protein